MNYKYVLQILVVLARTIAGKEFDETSGNEDNQNPKATTIFAGNIFQDIFLERVTREKVQFGHVFENPKDWEQRFEEKDYSINRHRGKVKWGNKDGGYGEHYWDINH